METVYGGVPDYFFWSLLAGGILALLYDFLRTFRRITAASTFGINLEDIIYFLLAAGILFRTAYDKNDGQLRWQGILGTILGFSVYRVLLRDKLVSLMVYCCHFFVKSFFIILKILLFPVELVYRLLKRPFILIGWYSHKTAERAGSCFKVYQERKQRRKKLKKAKHSRRMRENEAAVQK